VGEGRNLGPSLAFRLLNFQELTQVQPFNNFVDMYIQLIPSGLPNAVCLIFMPLVKQVSGTSWAFLVVFRKRGRLCHVSAGLSGNAFPGVNLENLVLIGRTLLPRCRLSNQQMCHFISLDPNMGLGFYDVVWLPALAP